VARRRGNLRPLLGIAFLVVCAFAAFEVTFAQFIHARLALPDHQVTLLFVYIGVLAAVVQGGLMGRLSRRFGERRLLLTGLLLTAGALALLSALQRLPEVLLLLPVLSLGTGLVNPSLSALVSGSAGAEEQGEALGAFQGIGSLARVVGPFLGEITLGSAGIGAPAASAAVLSFLAAGGAWVSFARARQAPGRSAGSPEA
jgi:predicted MFS family arabinose efflux permease